MPLFNETMIDTVMAACWTAYRSAKRGVDILESIGLSVEGSGDESCEGTHVTNDMSVLFEAQTAAENAIFAIAGIPRSTDMADKASAMLAAMAGAAGTGVSPAGADAVLAGLRGLISGDSPDPDLEPFEVTLAVTGSITIYGRDTNDALNRANAMPSEMLFRNGCWEWPRATDAYEV